MTVKIVARLIDLTADRCVARRRCAVHYSCQKIGFSQNNFGAIVRKFTSLTISNLLGKILNPLSRASILLVCRISNPRRYAPASRK